LYASGGSATVAACTLSNNFAFTESRINKAMLSGDGYFRIADERL
jgi:hypothetical protein